MVQDENGYFSLTLRDVYANDLYYYLLPSGEKRGDPASRFQPEGVFGPSAVIDPNFAWSDSSWRGIGEKELIFYECHVGTFSQSGTFEGLIEKIPYLKNLGITCLELMPVAQFSGRWNWGYDGVYLFAPQNTYGTPDQLKRLVNRCHEEGIAVCLDTVYNHFGPEGCFLREFGPYHTHRYKTPWGDAINFDGPLSDEVRRYFLTNALYWIHEYHIDALRLDALHAIYDFSAIPFLDELSQAVKKTGQELNRQIHLIGESDLNDSRMLRSSTLDALWNEDYHHALHVTLTRERQNYYCDYHGMKDLHKALEGGMVYQGEYSSFRKRRHGNSFQGIEREKYVLFLQNHDQIGNRPKSDRLSATLSFDMEKAAALFLLLSPSPPLLFMGQEYGEKAPFAYFVDYADEALYSAVYNGRNEEYELPLHEIPERESLFFASKLTWEAQAPLLSLYKKLIALRKTLRFGKPHVDSTETAILCNYGSFGMLCNFGTTPLTFTFPIEKILLHTDEKEFGGKEELRFQEKTLYLPAACGVLAALRTDCATCFRA